MTWLYVAGAAVAAAVGGLTVGRVIDNLEKAEGERYLTELRSKRRREARRMAK